MLFAYVGSLRMDEKLLPKAYSFSQYGPALSRQKIYLTNRFHVAVRLFSNRSQMTSKCDKNKKVALDS